MITPICPSLVESLAPRETTYVHGHTKPAEWCHNDSQGGVHTWNIAQVLMPAQGTSKWEFWHLFTRTSLQRNYVVQLVPETRSDMYVASEWDVRVYDTVGAREQPT